jgi:uncharacterized YccA/Bax inhibitor family protein
MITYGFGHDLQTAMMVGVGILLAYLVAYKVGLIRTYRG